VKEVIETLLNDHLDARQDKRNLKRIIDQKDEIMKEKDMEVRFLKGSLAELALQLPVKVTEASLE
jgi:hypothetical protein